MLSFLFTFILQQTDPMASIQGDWATEGYGAIVRLRPCDDRSEELCGDLIWVWDPEDIQEGRLGKLMLDGFRLEEGAWRKGRLINPEDGKTYRGSITQRGDDLLDLKGCTARILCASQTWRRLESLPHIRRAAAAP